jgi:signal peptidase I
VVKLLQGIWHWFTLRKVRQAVDLHRHIRRLLAQRRDLIDLEGAQAVADALAGLNRDLHRAEPVAVIEDSCRRLSETAGQWLGDLRRWRHREFFEVLAAAAIIVLTVRTFFLQPMKIPTGSMQPTLFGITVEDLRNHPDFQIPTGLTALVHRLVYGKSYYHVVAKAPGRLAGIGKPESVIPKFKHAPFLRKQTFTVGVTEHTVWFPPWDLPNAMLVNPDQTLFAYAGLLDSNRWYEKGDDLIKLAVTSGDHVLVDRLTYNFRRPKRGEIIVFRTAGIPQLHEGTHYLKRLIALGGERVRIGDDRHVVIDGKRLDATTPHFERVYAFNGPPHENEYSGHINDRVARQNRIPSGTVAPLFRNERVEFKVRPDHCLVMGDNTVGSLDGRRWGDFPERLVVGKFWMAYWPMSARFGWTADQ